MSVSKVLSTKFVTQIAGKHGPVNVAYISQTTAWNGSFISTDVIDNFTTAVQAKADSGASTRNVKTVVLMYALPFI